MRPLFLTLNFRRQVLVSLVGASTCIYMDKIKTLLFTTVLSSLAFTNNGYDIPVAMLIFVIYRGYLKLEPKQLTTSYLVYVNLGAMMLSGYVFAYTKFYYCAFTVIAYLIYLLGFRHDKSAD